MIAYRATVDVPRELAWFVAKLLLAERHRRGTPRGSRALTCFWQAVLGLRWFRDRTSADALARYHGISRATAYRYLDEVILVCWQSRPRICARRWNGPSTRDSRTSSWTGRSSPATGAGRRPSVSKARSSTCGTRARPTLTAGTSRPYLPDGFPLWVSPAEPGSVHDITAARIHALPALYQAAAAALPTLADPGYEGSGIGIFIPVKQPPWGAGTGHQYPYPQRHPAFPALPRGTRVRPAHRSLAHTAAHHRPAPARSVTSPRRARPRPFRARLPHLNAGVAVLA